jgi:hypothetical protein
MQIILISYVPGLFGEFSSYLFSKHNSNFVNDVETIITNDNRYLFPNYLEIINLDIKNLWSSEPLIISKFQIEKLNQFYGEKNLCVPTHWYNNDSNLCNLPGKKIRFFSSNLNILKLSYCLFWIKSHKNSNIWESRRREIEILIENNHIHSNILKELLISNAPGQNWKFLSVKENILKDGKLDLNFYIKQKFIKLLQSTITKNSSSWIYYDIGELIHGNQSNIFNIESLLNIKIDNLLIEEYREKNLDIIKKYLNLNFKDLQSSNWIDVLSEFIKS